MSVAFNKEQDGEAVTADLPDRPISSHPNLVTPEGLKKLDQELAGAPRRLHRRAGSWRRPGGPHRQGAGYS